MLTTVFTGWRAAQAAAVAGIVPQLVSSAAGIRSYAKSADDAPGLTEQCRTPATKGSERAKERFEQHQLFDLTGSTALITGGAGGIGARIALGMARSGADVIVADMGNEDGMEDVVQRIRSMGRQALGIKCDVRHRSSVDAAVQEAAEKLGSPDILVASAGIMGKLQPAHQVTHSAWQEVMSTNVEGAYNSCRAVYPHMKQRGRGKIVLISSIAAIRGAGSQVAYSCSKGAMLPLARSLAAAWGRDNIQVNTLLPGAINTPFLDVMLAKSKKLEAILQRIPLGRLGVPEDMVGPALFLSSHASDYVTGAEILVDGGGASLPMLACQDPEAYKP